MIWIDQSYYIHKRIHRQKISHKYKIITYRFYENNRAKTIAKNKQISNGKSKNNYISSILKKKINQPNANCSSYYRRLT